MSRKRSPHDFFFKEELGHGSYSTVFKAIDKVTNQLYAIKICSKKHIINENKVKYVTIEKNTLNLLAKDNHPGIIKLCYTFHDQDNLYFVLDYAPGGELLLLLRKFGKFDEIWSKHLMCQLIDSVQFIHSRNIIHRDLKPENVLISRDGKLMITDFGAASTLDENIKNLERTASFVGTAEYVSPELLLENKCFFSSDIWALGCILFQLLQGTPPFRGENELETFEKIVRLEYHWKIKINPSIMNLVSNILVINSNDRFNIKQIKSHNWFMDIDWNNKEQIWRGIQYLPQLSQRKPVHKSTLHNLGTPIKNIPITTKKKKPVKVTSTISSIVEWRKTLGIYNNVTKLPVSSMYTYEKKTMVPMKQNFNPRYSPITSFPSSQIYKPNPGPRQPKVISSKISLSNHKHLPNLSLKILKQSWIQIFDIPYSKDGPPLSLQSYNLIDDGLITDFILKVKHKLLESSKMVLLSMTYNGELFYMNDSIKTELVSIMDTDLSVYDFEFNEETQTGFLIMEKYNKRVWFLSLSTTTKISTINNDETWTECFFRVRKTIEDKELSEKLSKVSLQDHTAISPLTPSSLHSPILSGSVSDIPMVQNIESKSSSLNPIPLPISKTPNFVISSSSQRKKGSFGTPQKTNVPFTLGKHSH